MAQYVCNDCGTHFEASNLHKTCPSCGSNNTVPTNGGPDGPQTKWWKKLKKFFSKYKWYFTAVIIFLIIKMCDGPPPPNPKLMLDYKQSSKNIFIDFISCDPDQPLIKKNIINSVINKNQNGDRYILLPNGNKFYPLFAGDITIKWDTLGNKFCGPFKSKNYRKVSINNSMDFQKFDKNKHIALPNTSKRKLKAESCGGSGIFSIKPKFENENFEYSLDNKKWSSNQKFNIDELTGKDYLFIRNKRMKKEVSQLPVPKNLDDTSINDRCSQIDDSVLRNLDQFKGSGSLSFSQEIDLESNLSLFNDCGGIFLNGKPTTVTNIIMNWSDYSNTIEFKRDDCSLKIIL
tara:strand:- start:222 stop:1259 length:1038 start_codon:yes stop_codon:yes gene_type:complete